MDLGYVICIQDNLRGYLFFLKNTKFSPPYWTQVLFQFTSNKFIFILVIGKSTSKNYKIRCNLYLEPIINMYHSFNLNFRCVLATNEYLFWTTIGLCFKAIQFMVSVFNWSFNLAINDRSNLRLKIVPS